MTIVQCWTILLLRKLAREPNGHRPAQGRSAQQLETRIQGLASYRKRASVLGQKRAAWKGIQVGRLFDVELNMRIPQFDEDAADAETLWKGRFATRLDMVPHDIPPGADAHKLSSACVEFARRGLSSHEVTFVTPWSDPEPSNRVAM